MGTVPPDMLRLLDDCEIFVSNILQNENLGEYAEKTRQILLNNFRVVHVRNPEDFPFRSDSEQEDGSDDNRSTSLGRSAPSDDASVASDYQDDGAPEYFGPIFPVAAQDLSNILKQGYLEKKRRGDIATPQRDDDRKAVVLVPNSNWKTETINISPKMKEAITYHSFFGSEWQKRWCVLNNTIFYYFGNEKDKQQKGSFYINGYSAELVSSLRKDSKKNASFELSAPGRRSYQFTASNPQEAREWVNQINFVLRDLSSNLIPFDDDEEEEGDEEEEETYDDIEGVTGPPPPRPGAAQAPPSAKQGAPDMGEVDEEDDDIYEELPEDTTDQAESSDGNNAPAWSSDYANYYQGLWDCAADEPDELAFQRGDLIYIISKEYNIYGWWVGELNGTVGIVPKDFLHPAYIL